MRPSAFSPSLRTKLAEAARRADAAKYLRQKPAPVVAAVGCQRLGATTIRLAMRHEGRTHIAAGRTVPLALLALSRRVHHADVYATQKRPR